jgi:lauroyl/myristoyl acyltransferase
MWTLSRACVALRVKQRQKMVAGRLLVLRPAIALVRALPRPVAFHGGRLLGIGFSFLPTTRRRGLRANLAVAMDLPIDDRRVRKASRVAMGHWLLNFVDLFRIGRADFPAMIRRAHVDGWDLFNEAYALGRGVVLVSAHLGPYETIVQRLADMGIEVLIPIERIEPPELLDIVCAGRVARGLRVVPIGPDAFRAMASMLKQGGVVVVVSDRDLAGTGEPVCFFGRRVTLPSAAVLLALRTGAPLMGAFAHRDRLGRISGRFTPVLDLGQRRARLPDGKMPARTLRAAVAEGMKEVSALLEREIRRRPSQWVVLQPLFDRLESGESASAAKEVDLPGHAARAAL